MTFEVVQAVKQGWWRDRVVVRALDHVREERLRLGWDFMGNPGATREYISMMRGDEVETSLPHALSRHAGPLTLKQLANSSGFKQFWRKGAKTGHDVL